MGTNFYHKYTIGPLAFLGIGLTEKRHIGKRSGGWEFSFRGYKDRTEYRDGGMNKKTVKGITSWKQWKKILKRGKIFDEYGTQWNYSEFVEKVEMSRAPGFQNHYNYTIEAGHQHMYNNFHAENWKDDDGWSFSSTEFC
jgi:hypothetical protein